MRKNDADTYLLGLETSGPTSGVYLSRGEKVVGQITLNVRNIHSRSLAMMVSQLLHHLDLDYRKLEAIVLSAGPGSFTGLRIGYSLAKGLAHSLHIPIVEVPTLDIWVHQQGRCDLPVMGLIDAHRDEIFYAVYRWSQDELVRESEYLITEISKLPDILQEKTLLVGGDVSHLKNTLREIAGGKILFPHPLLGEPQGWALLGLGLDKFRQGLLSTAEICEPLYLRAFKGVM